jgi:early secretory antigenic target protein ESAT-6
MSGRIMVTPEELQQTSSQFNAKAAELEQMLQSVQSQIESLRSTWQGQAAANFDALMAQWTQDVQGIN